LITNRSRHRRRRTSFAAQWNNGKPQWEWLFRVIDTNEDGYINAAEYDAFQDYKARNPNWMSKRPPTNE
jgi:hypothetical protein